MVTRDELARIMPALSSSKLDLYLPHLQEAMRENGITSRLQEAAFLAQLGHESGDLRFWEEIWGPTPAQRGYEGRRDLGNTEKGDGFRFRGRGPIQITGRANYRRYGAILDVDLEAHPELAALPEFGFRIAATYWRVRGLNDLAERQEFVTITKRINGGTTGIEDRKRRYRRALAILDEDSEAITVVVRGQELPIAGVRRDGAVFVPLRATAHQCNWQVISTGEHSAIIQAPNALRTRHQVLLQIAQTGIGYTPAAEFCGVLNLAKHWDPETLTVTIGDRT